MRREAIKNFISEAERLALVGWFEESLKAEKHLKPGLSRGQYGYDKRKTTRAQKVVEFPAVAYQIFARIKKRFGFTDNCVTEPTAQGDGMIAVATYPGGDTYAHRDPSPCGEGRAVIRFNIVVQKPDSGGVLWVKDESGNEIEWDTEECELHAYNVSDFTHAVTRVGGERPRFIWLFSMCCPYHEWENGIITRK